MKLSFILLMLFSTQVYGYLAENYSPFTISIDKQHVKPGDTVQISWSLTPGVKFPLYGYASSLTSKTDIGLLAPKSSRSEKYVFLIDTDILVQDYNYTWTVGDDTPLGNYQVGIGFFYHEVSTEIHVHSNEKAHLFWQQFQTNSICDHRFKLEESSSEQF